MSFKMVFKARKSDLPILRYVNLNIRNYAQTLVECLPLFEKRVLPRSGPFSQVLSHFISNFARVASPLYALTKKGQEFLWTPLCKESFAHLKSLLITVPVLSYPQFGEGKEFIVKTDASTLGPGAVLSQCQEDGHVHSIAYASRQLHDGEKKH